MQEEKFISLYKRLISYSVSKNLPDEKTILELADKAVTVLENESGNKTETEKLQQDNDKQIENYTSFSYRPKNSKGESGGLIDLRAFDKTVVIVPDIHGRRDFLSNLLLYKINDEYIYKLLTRNEIFVVCVGDAIHTETMPKDMERWLKAYDEYENNNIINQYMMEEMIQNINILCMLMELKIAFPENFFFLKGNHENIDNSSENGNRAFRKFASEGSMVKDFIKEYYSDATLHIIKCYENHLPLLCLFKDFAVSHAEPVRAFSRQDVIDCATNEDVVYGLTWTKNDAALPTSVSESFNLLFEEGDKKEYRWFGGHRPVEGKYCLRQNGKYIQIHNPDLQNITIVKDIKDFNPETDIVSVI